MPPSQKLVSVTGRDETPSFAIESTVGRFSSEPVTALSHEVFDVLMYRDASASIRRCCYGLGCEDGEAFARMSKEILVLWSARVIRLLPVRRIS